jgi:hypothetical protein
MYDEQPPQEAAAGADRENARWHIVEIVPLMPPPRATQPPALGSGFRHQAAPAGDAVDDPAAQPVSRTPRRTTSRPILQDLDALLAQAATAQAADESGRDAHADAGRPQGDRQPRSPETTARHNGHVPDDAEEATFSRLRTFGTRREAHRRERRVRTLRMLATVIAAGIVLGIIVWWFGPGWLHHSWHTLLIPSASSAR